MTPNSGLAFILYGLLFATTAQAADRHPTCDAIPSLLTCGDPSAVLSAETARSLLNEEFDAARARGVVAAAACMRVAIGDAGFTAVSPAYAYLRDKSLAVAHEIDDPRDRFSYLLLVSHALNRAGDREAALRTVRDRLPLIKRWPAPDPEKTWLMTRLEAAQLLSSHAARFGDLELSLQILDEAYPQSERDSYRYHWNRGEAYLEAEHYKGAEESLRLAADAVPFAPRGKRDIVDDPGVHVHELLVRALVMQGKSYERAMTELRRELAEFEAPLRLHARNYFWSVVPIARADLDAGRALMDHAQAIRRAGTETKLVLEEEASTCIELKDDACAEAVAREMEALLANVPTDDTTPRESEPPRPSATAPPTPSDIATVYAWAGAFEKSRAWMREVDRPGCSHGIRSSIMSRMIEDNKLSDAQLWIEEWVRCELRDMKERTQRLDELNWSEIVEYYAAVARAFHDQGRLSESKEHAETALLLAIEAMRRAPDVRSYRAGSLAAAYGALAATE